MKISIFISFSSMLLGLLPANAAVLVNSTFTDSSLGAAGRNAANSSNLTPWFLISSATAGNATVVDDSGGGGLGKSMQVNAGNTIYTTFSSSSLADGESLTLSLMYRFSATPSTGNETFRIALSNANSAAAIIADQTSISDANEQQYVGYYAGLAIGVNPSTNGTVLRQRDSGNMNSLTSTSQSSTLGSNNSGVASAASSHSLEFSISRSGSTLSFSTKIDGNPMLNGTDATSIYTSFNALTIAGVGGTVVLDSIVLQSVPEPTAYVLFGLGTTFLLCRSRRRA